jgi:hypothetical protein
MSEDSNQVNAVTTAAASAADSVESRLRWLRILRNAFLCLGIVGGLAASLIDVESRAGESFIPLTLLAAILLVGAGNAAIWRRIFRRRGPVLTENQRTTSTSMQVALLAVGSFFTVAR